VWRDSVEALVDSLDSGRERHASGESIAQRSRRSQRGIVVGRWKAFGGQLGFWAGKTRIRGDHRTEVTEVTEGDCGWTVEGIGGQLRFWAGKTRIRREHRTEATEVTEGGTYNSAAILTTFSLVAVVYGEDPVLPKKGILGTAITR
jgi:hypothetical protein